MIKILFENSKALYSLNQAPRAWYYHLDEYLQQQGFTKGFADRNLCMKMDDGKILTIVVYIDYVFFR